MNVDCFIEDESGGTIKVTMHPDFPEEWLQILYFNEDEAIASESISMSKKMAEELVRAIALLQRVQNNES